MSKKFKRLLLICMCVGIFTGLAGFILTDFKSDDESLEKEVSAPVLAPSVSAGGAILINSDDGKVIYEKNADKKLYPASTTKIMTAIVVFQTLEDTGTDLDSEVIIPKEAVGVEGSSIYLKAGEKVAIRELMYGMMLQSGNDAATALAICCGGTHFVNPSGLFDEEHYTTARDLACIGREAMKNDEFRQIVGAEKWKSEDTERSFVNKNKTIGQYDGATGIKIGFTKRSGRTLVASAKRGETELIAVVLNDGNWFNDAYAMIDYGFSRQDVNLQ